MTPERIAELHGRWLKSGVLIQLAEMRELFNALTESLKDTERLDKLLFHEDIEIIWWEGAKSRSKSLRDRTSIDAAIQGEKP